MIKRLIKMLIPAIRNSIYIETQPVIENEVLKIEIYVSIFGITIIDSYLSFDDLKYRINKLTKRNEDES